MEKKFLTAHAARRNFSEVICRACAVVVHSWFSHLHGKFCVLALRTFSVSSRGQSFPVSLILHQSSLRGTSSSIHTPSTHQRISSGCQWRSIFDFDLSMIHVGQPSLTEPHRRFASPFAGCGHIMPGPGLKVKQILEERRDDDRSIHQRAANTNELK